MTETKVRTAVGLLLVVSQFCLIGIVLVLWALHRFLFDEMTTTLTLLTPMFAIHTTTIVKHLLANKEEPQPVATNVSTAFVFLSFFFPSVFVLALLAVILLKVGGTAFAGMEQFKTALGIIQTAFGVYLGLVISALFEIKKTGKVRDRKL